MRRKLEKATHRLRACVGTVALVSSIMVGLPSPAHAAEDAVVEALIQRGIQLRRGGSDDQALNVFLEAERQDQKSVRVLLHIVTAAQASGKWLMADSYMRKVSALKDDDYYRRHSDAIDAVRRSIAARVGTFQAQGEPEGASVRLDGQLVGTLPMESPAAVESGTYVMEVQKPGFYRLRRAINVVGGVLTREPVELNAMPTRTDLAAGGEPAGAAATEPGVEPGTKGSWLTSPALAWTLVGVGAASGITSAIVFQLREDRVKSWNDEGRCIASNGETREERCGGLKNDADTFQTLGIVSAIAGVALAGTGAVLLLGSDDEEKGVASRSASTAGSLKVTGCDAGFMSIACRGSF
jgi:hypothetical protein